MRFKKIFLNLIFSALIFVFMQILFSLNAYAVSCSPPISGNYTLTQSCSFANQVDGVDAGTGTTNTAVLTVPAGMTLTIGNISNQTIGVGSISFGQGNSSAGNVGSFSTTSQGQLPQTIDYNDALTATINGTTYIYSIGGSPGNSGTSSVVYAATVSSAGNVGTFSTTGQTQLPITQDGMYNFTSATVGSSTYVYMIGGGNSASTVYKATINGTTGAIGAWSTTGQIQLPQNVSNNALSQITIGGTTYIYVLGGQNSGYLSEVYKYTVDSSGNLSTLNSTSQSQLPSCDSHPGGFTATVGSSNYIYVLGGVCGSYFSTVYKATLSSTGDVGTWSTTNQAQLPVTMENMSVDTVAINGTTYVYVLGGDTSGRVNYSSVYRATISSNGDVGTWTTANIGQLGQNVTEGASVVASSGGTNYIYLLGGYNGTSALSTVYQAAINSGLSDGSIIINTGSGGSLKNAPIWVPNADGDGYPTTANPTEVVQATQPAGDSRRDVLTTLTTADCNDSDSNLYQNFTGYNGINASATSICSGSYLLGTTVPRPAGERLSSCSLLTSGAIDCWGYNNDGELGSGNYTQTDSPVGVSGISTGVGVSGGYNGACSILSGGSVQCWGDNTYGQLGISSGSDIGTFSTTNQGQLPDDIQNGESVTATVGSNNYIYFLGGNAASLRAASSTVYKATISSTGDIGTFSTTNQGQLPDVRQEFAASTVSLGGTNYVYVLGGNGSAGYESTVYKATISSTGDIGTFSTTSQGQLPQAIQYLSSNTITIGGTNYIYALGGETASSYQSTVYKATISSTGDIGTFSTTNQGQLPKAFSDFSSNIVTISGTSYIYVLGGGTLSYFSTVYKATISSTGDIGTFSTVNQGQLPQILSGQTSVTATVGGTNYIFVMGGNNGHYQSTVYKATISSTGDIGTFSTTNQAQLPQIIAYQAGSITTIGGTTYAYVLGGFGSAQLSTVYKATIGAGVSNKNVPVTISGISSPKAISSGEFHSCALMSGGTIDCWGDNSQGELGNGSSGGISTSPVQVSGISTATAISSGYEFTCAVLSNETVECWGYNNDGQLGNGTTSSSSTPVQVSGITNAVNVTAGWQQACALLSDGTVKCWGYNASGQLGNGSYTSSSTPVTVSGLSSVKEVASGGSHVCALINGGTIKCWGDNSNDQLGNGSTATNSDVPVQVSNITTGAAISGGDSHECAVLTNSTVYCWGLGTWGELGNSTYTSSNVPVQVTGITTAQ